MEKITIDNVNYRLLLVKNNEENENKYFNYDYYLINKGETIQYKLKIFVEKRKKEDKILYHVSLNHLDELQNTSNRKYINLDKIFREKKDNIYYFGKNEREKRQYTKNSYNSKFDDDLEVIELKRRLQERIRELKVKELEDKIKELESLKKSIK